MTLAALTASFPIEFASDGDPRSALSTFIDVATPILRDFGYTVEAKGSDWAHWTHGCENVIRYAFREADRRGVRVFGQGEIPAGVKDALARRVPEEAGGYFAKPS